MEFKIEFTESKIRSLAEEYVQREKGKGTWDLEVRIEKNSPHIRNSGFCNRKNFLDICEWKLASSQCFKRNLSLCESNTEDVVCDATRKSFSEVDKKRSIKILEDSLSGVSWAVASVLLHFGHQDWYPIWDFRALESLGVPKKTGFSFKLWIKYTDYCRKLSHEYGVSMRDFDRALWQYSKINQSSEWKKVRPCI